MAGDTAPPTGPDLTAGVKLSDIPDGGALAGRVGDRQVLLSRAGERCFAVSATCTHYSGPLAEGLIKDGKVHCPWHHACFSLKTGEALEAPAFDPLDRFEVRVADGVATVGAKLETQPPILREGGPERIVIVGGGAAGFAAAEMLRRRGYAGTLTMLSADAAPPVDRPNLSKDYLAGTAPEEWIPLKGEEFYADRNIDLRTGTEVVDVDLAAKAVVTASGERHAYDALLLATGAEPIRLPAPGFDRPNVFTLRTLADARAIIGAAKSAKRAAVIGASFIGLEVAASLRAREIEVHVIAPEDLPLKKILGPELGAHVRDLHQAKGVVFHLGETATSFDGKALTLSGGSALQVDFVVQGVGVKPRLKLAEKIGAEIDNGVIVDEHFATSVDGVYAAGDIARYPDPVSDELIRVEHWVAAERQGQIAALNMLGEHIHTDTPPFFWSIHYDTTINYTGHAVGWDGVEIDGAVHDGDATLRYVKRGGLLAAATLGRDHENLEIEDELRE